MVTDELPHEELTEGVDIAHTLAPVQALDRHGQAVRLGTLWEDGPAALIFLRHFG